MQVESFFEWLGQALGSVIRFIVDGLSGLFGALTHAGGNFIDGLSRTLGMDTSIISIITLIGEICDRFDIEIGPKYMVNENFNSVEAMWEMISEILEEE